jgi:putative sterol carrier protein
MIQWDFSDAPTAVSPGRLEHPDLTFHCPLSDWVDIAAGRTEPWRAVIHGQVRPTGRLRMLIRAPKLFG